MNFFPWSTRPIVTDLVPVHFREQSAPSSFASQGLGTGEFLCLQLLPGERMLVHTAPVSAQMALPSLLSISLSSSHALHSPLPPKPYYLFVVS